jgi:hypothetical protein
LSLNFYGRSVERGGPAKFIDCKVVCYVIDAGSRVFLGHLQLIAGAVMSPTMRDAYDASHHLLRDLEWQYDRTHSRPYPDVLAFGEVAMGCIVRMHENCALRFSPN